MAGRTRYLEAQVRRDLRRKMVFLAGPRQVGKTTLAKRLLGRKAGYLNWDVAEHREAILQSEFPVSKVGRSVPFDGRLPTAEITTRRR